VVTAAEKLNTDVWQVSSSCILPFVFFLLERGSDCKTSLILAYMLIDNKPMQFGVTSTPQTNWSSKESYSHHHIDYPFFPPLS
jgi:hypothetical protein